LPERSAAALQGIGRDRTRQQTHRNPQLAFRQVLN
jgi:hypothetical protein